MTKVRNHPGPWPSIPVSLLPTKCSEQAAAGSSRRQQQQTAGISRKQEEAAEKIKSKKNILYLECIRT